MTERVERGGAVSVPAFGYNIENKEYVINPDTAPFVKKKDFYRLSKRNPND